MLVPSSITLAVTATNTTPANRILAANALVNRFVRGVYVTNTTGAAIVLGVAIGAAAIISATNGDVAFGLSIPANSASYPVAQYGGQGRRALGIGSLNEIMAFGATTGLILTVIYADDTLV
jgi:hypothetical protein